MRLNLKYRPGMFVYSIAFLSGVVLLQQFSVLSRNLLAISAFTIFFINVYLFVTKSSRQLEPVKNTISQILLLILLIQVGFIYAFLSAEQSLKNRLDDAYVGVNFIITGTVSSTPVTTANSQRFEFIVRDYSDISEAVTVKGENFPDKIRLSWFQGSSLQAGEVWRFEVKLKPPNGLMNPGGFDYEKWLFLKGFDATGYVVKSSNNVMLQTASVYSINRYRQLLSTTIDQLKESSGLDSFSMVKALAIGEKSLMSESQWEILTRTGTSHLMAISGLHIGLAVLFTSIVIRRFIPVFVTIHFPAQHIALFTGVIMACLYALVAGLSIPTQRALIMLMVLSALVVLRRNHRPFDALGFALLSVLLFDPLSVLSAGFWFSFSAVAAIFISFTQNEDKESNDSYSFLENSKSIKILKSWIHLQMVISLFLLPLSLFMFNQVSLVSPLVNLLLIPYVSFLVVPVVLIAILFSTVFPSISSWLLIFAAQTLDFIWPILSYISSQAFSIWHYDEIGVLELSLTTFSLVTLYFSKYLVDRVYEIKINLLLFRLFFLIIFLSCFIPIVNSSDSKLKTGQIKLTVLDVGQGSSAVIQTTSHTLIFDAGAKFSRKFDTGKSIIIPYLKSENIHKIDTLVISHGDADHIGGAQTILDAYPVTKLIGQDIEHLSFNNKQLCYSGLQWRWDDVNFKFLSPVGEFLSASTKKQTRNNHSCVLQIRSDSGAVLLTGDIEKSVEQNLMEKYGTSLASDVLIVPHHGSHTSSMSSFITTVNPKISIISVGYHNRYQLPNHRVINRYNDFYENEEDRLLLTYSSGAISITLKQGGDMKLQRYRETARKYWHH